MNEEKFHFLLKLLEEEDIFLVEWVLVALGRLIFQRELKRILGKDLSVFIPLLKLEEDNIVQRVLWILCECAEYAIVLPIDLRPMFFKLQSAEDLATHLLAQKCKRLYDVK